MPLRCCLTFIRTISQLFCDGGCFIRRCPRFEIGAYIQGWKCPVSAIFETQNVDDKIDVCSFVTSISTSRHWILQLSYKVSLIFLYIRTRPRVVSRVCGSGLPGMISTSTCGRRGLPGQSRFPTRLPRSVPPRLRAVPTGQLSPAPPLT